MASGISVTPKHAGREWVGWFRHPVASVATPRGAWPEVVFQGRPCSLGRAMKGGGGRRHGRGRGRTFWTNQPSGISQPASAGRPRTSANRRIRLLTSPKGAFRPRGRRAVVPGRPANRRVPEDRDLHAPAACARAKPGGPGDCKPFHCALGTPSANLRSGAVMSALTVKRSMRFAGERSRGIGRGQFVARSWSESAL